MCPIHERLEHASGACGCGCRRERILCLLVSAVRSYISVPTAQHDPRRQVAQRAALTRRWPRQRRRWERLPSCLTAGRTKQQHTRPLQRLAHRSARGKPGCVAVDGGSGFRWMSGLACWMRSRKAKARTCSVMNAQGKRWCVCTSRTTQPHTRAFRAALVPPWLTGPRVPTCSPLVAQTRAPGGGVGDSVLAAARQQLLSV